MTQIDSIHHTGFMDVKPMGLALPANGIVVLLGPNGVGKSSVVEAVAVAIWGTTLRGKPAMRTGVAGGATVRADGWEVARSWTKAGVKSVEVLDPDFAPVVFDTPTKAQAWLASTFGPLAAWRRTNVLSSHDAAHFSTATDEERKVLLERVLGIDVFDRAAESVLEDLRVARAVQQTNQSNLTVAVIRVDEAERALQRGRVARSEAASSAPSAPTSPRPDLAQSELERKTAADALRVATAEFARRTAAVEKHARDQRDADAAYTKAVQCLNTAKAGKCAMCGQAVGQDLVVELEAAVAARAVTGRTLADHVEPQPNVEEVERCRAAVVAIDEQIKHLQQANVVWRCYDAAQLAWEERKVSASVGVDELDARLRTLTDDLANLDDEVAGSSAAVALLEQVQLVLGVRGVRSRVLGEALVGVEAAANAWLSRLFEIPVSLVIRPITENKSGTVSSKISMDVDGVGGGYGYQALSGGQRRRVDAAVLLALSEVASAASGRPPGTIFLDEVFDSLDTQGVESTQRALTELAKDRCVVLITHVEQLVHGLPSAEVVRLS